MAVTAKPQKGPHDMASITKELSRENSLQSPVVQHLRRQVANAFVLYTNYKLYHWQTFGPLFRDLHKLFDELAEDVLKTLDPLAERVRMIGPDPPAHPIELSDLATVAPAAPHSTMRDFVEEADRNLLIVVKKCARPYALPTITAIQEPWISFLASSRSTKSMSGGCAISSAKEMA